MSTFTYLHGLPTYDWQQLMAMTLGAGSISGTPSSTEFTLLLPNDGTGRVVEIVFTGTGFGYGVDDHLTSGSFTGGSLVVDGVTVATLGGYGSGNEPSFEGYNNALDVVRGGGTPEEIDQALGDWVQTEAVTSIGSADGEVLANSAFDDFVEGNGGNDTLFGGSGMDTLVGGTGDDAIFGHQDQDFLVPGSGSDTVDGGDGWDELSFDGGGGSSFVNVTIDGAGSGTATGMYDGAAIDTTFSNIEAIRGTVTDDTFTVTETGSGTPFSSNLNGEYFSIDLTGGHGSDHFIDEAGGVILVRYDIEALIDNTGGSVAVNVSGHDITLTFDEDPDIILTSGQGLDPYGDTDTYDGVRGFTLTDLSDLFVGGSDGYFVDGRGGNDLIESGDGDDFLMGGDGNDTITGGGGYDNILGGSGDDSLEGGDGRDTFVGGAGNDTIDGGNDRDRVNYQDELYADPPGSNGVIVNLSNSGINGTASGHGTVFVDAHQALDTFGDTDTLISIEQIRGTELNDYLQGGDDDDWLRGDFGNDVVLGGGGNDYLVGGAGSDTVDGQEGNDTLAFEGENGGDSVTIVVDGAGSGIASGQDRGGTVNTSFSGIEAIRGSIGDDSFTIAVAGRGTEYSDDYYLNDANNATDDQHRAIRTTGGAGADTFTDLANVYGGVMLVDYREEFRMHDEDATGVVVNTTGDDITEGASTIAGGTARDTYGDIDTLIGVHAFQLTDSYDRFAGGDDGYFVNARGGDDLIETGEGHDNINGGTGNDTIRTFGGDDSLNGQDGDDLLEAGDGDDYLRGGQGADTLDGGDGNDRISYRDDRLNDDTEATHGVAVNLSNDTIEVPLEVGGTLEVDGGFAYDSFDSFDTLISIEHVEGSEFADYIVGSEGHNELEGRDGNDFIDGRGGNDWLHGGAGNDTLLGGEGSDDLQGGDGDDYLVGGDANDFSDDFFVGGRGNDTMIGGENENEFNRVQYNGEIDWNNDDPGTHGVIVNLSGQAGSAPPYSSFASIVIGGHTFSELNAFEAFDSYGDRDSLINIQNANGTDFGDIIVGGPESSDFDGRGGDDLLIGGSGSNQYRGGDGNDTIIGGDGDDFANGGAGDNYMDGGESDHEYDNVEYYDQGAGIVVTKTSAENGTVFKNFDGSTDTFVNFEIVVGSDYADIFNGSNEDDDFTGNGGADTFNGGDGFDKVVYEKEQNGPNGQAAHGVVVNLTSHQITGASATGIDNATVEAGTAIDSFGDIDELNSIEGIRGTKYDDLIIGRDDGYSDLDGDSGNDWIQVGAYVADNPDDQSSRLRGGDGNDTLIGGDGRDDFDAGAGDDLVQAGGGQFDYINGSSGNDTIDGGAGYDMIGFKRDNGDDHIHVVLNTDGLGTGTITGVFHDVWVDGEDTAGTVSTTFSNLERVVGTAGDDSFTNNGFNPTADAEWLFGDRSETPFTAFSFVGGKGNDTFTDTTGTSTATVIDYDEEKWSRDNYDGHTWGSEPGEIGVAINFSGSDIVADGDTIASGTARDTFGDTDTIIGVKAFRLTDANDTFYAGDGADFEADGRQGDDLIVGGSGNDLLIGDDGNDTLVGGGGNDTLWLGRGDDSATGGAGADTFGMSEGTDVVTDFNPAEDVIDLGWFGNIQSLADFLGLVSQGNTTDMVVDFGDGNVTTFTGVDWNDITEANLHFYEVQTIDGDEFDNELHGGGNAEIINGYEGNDELYGHGGNDTINGGDDRDTLIGGQGNDVLDGGSGGDDKDRVQYDHEADDGGTRGVIINLSDNELENVTAEGQSVQNVAAHTAIDSFGDTDTLIDIEDARGTDLDDYIVGDDDRNSLQGRAGDDTIYAGGGDDFIRGDQGSDEIHGGDGHDMLSYEGEEPGDGMTVTFASGQQGAGTAIGQAFGDAVNATFDGIEAVRTWGGNDTFIAEAGAEGTEFSDTYYINDGDDETNDEHRTIRVSGGQGDDTYTDLTGAGLLMVDYREEQEIHEVTTGVFVNMTGGNVSGLASHTAMDTFGDIDTLNGVQAFILTDAADTFEGDDAGYFVRGRGGNDTITGGNGNDTLRGDDGDDSIIGGDGIDELNGGDGNDTIIGGNGGANNRGNNIDGGRGNDYIETGSGDDYIHINWGTDTILAGGGHDVLATDRIQGDDESDHSGDYMDVVFTGVGSGSLSGSFGSEGISVTFSAVEQVRGTQGADTFTAQNGASATENGEDFYLSDGDDETDDRHLSIKVTGGAGADTFTDNTGVFGGVLKVDYQEEKWQHDDYDGGPFGNGTTQFGVIVNMSATEQEGVVSGTARDTFGDTDTINGVHAFKLSDAADSFYAGDDGYSVQGHDGDDTIIGGAGDDNLGGDRGDDSIVGGDGNDWLGGWIGNDTLIGGDGNDNMEGDGGDDSMVGGAGFDWFRGGAGNDTMDGGAEDDKVQYFEERDDNDNFGNEGVIVNLSDGDISVDLGDGNGVQLVLAHTAKDSFGDTDSLISISNVEGTDLADYIVGDDGFNELFGRGGNDTLIGGDGEDHLQGGDGDDSMVGGGASDNEADFFVGGRGNDTMIGGENENEHNRVEYDGETDWGNDDSGTHGVIVNLSGQAGSAPPYSSFASIEIGGHTFSELNAFEAFDSYGDRDSLINIQNATGTQYDDIIVGGPEDNDFDGRDGNDLLIGGSGNNQYRGGAGNDTIIGGDGDDFANGGAGDNYMDGGEGENEYDNVEYIDQAAGIVVTKTSGESGTVFKNADDSTDTFVNFEIVVGSDHADIFNGSDENDDFTGNGGADTFNGGDGFDSVIYEKEQYGPNGGSSHGVVVNLSDSALTDVSAEGTGTVTVAAHTAVDAFGDVDSLNSIERIRGTSFGDYLKGSDIAFSELQGHDGDDTLVAGAFDGGDQDSSRLEGGRGDDLLLGGEFGDQLSAGSGNDTVLAGGGNDYIRGSAGTDSVDGGDGYDVIGFGGINGDGGGNGITVTFDLLGVAGGGVISGEIHDYDENEGAVSTTFENIERIEGTNADDVFQVLGDGFVTSGGGKVFVDYLGGLRGQQGLVDLSGGDGADSFTDLSTAEGGVLLISYDGERWSHSDFDGHVWGSEAGEHGVVVNFSAIQQTALDFDFNDGNGPDDFVIAAATGLDTFGALDSYSGIRMTWLTAADDWLWASNAGTFAYGGAGEDHLFGGSGNDMLVGGDGDDTMSGGLGHDTLTYAMDSQSTGDGVIVNLSASDQVVGGDTIAAGTARDNWGNTDTVDGFDIVVGTTHDDVIYGGAGSASGAPGEGMILIGGSGDDLIVGGDNADALRGDQGNDTLDGGDGIDTVDYHREVLSNTAEWPYPGEDEAARAGVIVNLSGDDLVVGSDTIAAGTARDSFGTTDELSNIENVDGSEFGDVVLGSAGNNLIRGFEGDDTLNGGGGDDTIYGGAGDDTIVFAGGTLTVADFVAGGTDDQIDLTAFTSINSLAELLATLDDAGNHTDAVFVLGGQTLTLTGVDYDNLTSADFLFSEEGNVDPVITSDGGEATAALNVLEGTTSVTTVVASDANAGDTLTYAITGGADQALFTIDPDTGALSFVAPPDREAPADDGTDNVYEVIVTVSDGNGGSDSQTINVTVTDANDTAPDITSNGGGAAASVSIAENSTLVTTVTATDPDTTGTLTYSLVGGADAALFAINPTTGQLSFSSGRDFETPTDNDTDNIYEVTVQVSDGVQSVTQAISVTVTNVNESPAFTSGTTANVNENSTAVMTVTAADPDAGAALTYSIVPGGDGNKFTIDGSSGALSFLSPPDFETPTDSDTNNTYAVTVLVSDGLGGTASQLITVTVTNQNEAPAITSDGAGPTAAVSIDEGTTTVTTVTATDPDAGTTLTYSISGGVDQALFTIDANTGELSFVTPPDHDTPADDGGDNVYDVEVTVSDGTLTDVQAIAVTVNATNVDPVITSDGGTDTASINLAENSTAVTTVAATDGDNDTLTYSIIGGADQAKFEIDANSGALSFAAAPDFETPTDDGADNSYVVTVQVSDGHGGFDTQTITVNVTNLNDNTPVIGSDGGGATASLNVAENTTAVTTVTATDGDSGATITYSISGGADAALFQINPTTGVVSFIAPPDREAPADAGGNNVYDIVVRASDGTNFDEQALAITVTNVNDNAPVISSNGGGASASVNVAENTTAVTTVTATDADAGTTLTYSIVGGADAAKFSINPTTGVLSFIAAPDFENPTDAGANNVYDVTVQVSDGLNVDTQAIAVTVTDGTGVIIIGSEGADTVNGSQTVAGQPLPTNDNDQIYGNGGDDNLSGLDGNDTIDGGAGIDTMIGGLGDDTYYVDVSGDVVTEAAGQGNDTVYSSAASYTLGDNIENLILSGTANINGTGNAGNNTITGNTGNNTINGGAGADTMIGGYGDDTYVVDNAGDTIVEISNNYGGTDTVQSSVNSYTLQLYLENLTLVGSAISGTGNKQWNVITGNALNNVLNGDEGNDTLIGGDGDDTYYVDAIGDVIIEEANQGNDTVYSSFSYVLGDNVENLVLTGTANLSGYGNGSANQLTGNAGNNVLDGGAGIDTMIGGLGDDTYYVDVSGDVVTEAAGQGNDTVYSSAASYTLGDNIENLILSGTANINGTGNAGNNTITGNTGNNTINGGAGADTMIGGYGDDTYVVDNAGDTIVEISNNYGGTDTVQSSVNSYTLQLYLENLTLVGSAISGTGNKQWNVITGNALNNVLNGDEGNDTLIGGDGDDTYYVDAIGDVIIEEANQGNDTVYSSFSYVLGDNVENLVLTGTANLSGYGNGSANQLTGNAGNNVLDGGAGIDTMIGGLGDDTYYVDVSGDVVTEAAGQGNDTVYSSAASYTLGDNIENLILSGTANINGTGNAGNNTITGNTGNNTINGGAGADTMIGGYGDDTYVVDNAGDTIVEISNNYGGTDTVQSSVNSYTLQLYLENLTLVGSAISGTGNKQWNVITGNALNNVLNGDEGNDTLIGGDGDDTYYVDAIGDVIIEEANQGNDTVYSSFSYVLGDNVENLVLTGTANLSGYGNGSANQLTGNAGNNVLDGGAGIDTMIGGLGDDTYYVDVSGDVVTEAAGQGNDTVYSSAASYTLGDNIENLILSGTANINGTGNAGNNTITGNTGNNTINGGAGADTMIGGYGDDTYVVDNAGDTIVEISNNYGGTDTVQSSVNSYTLQLYLENLTLVGSAISGTGNKQWNVITGNALNNVLNGDEGNDTLIGGDGDDTYYVDAIGDVIIEEANQGNDTVYSSFSYVLGDNVENLVLTGTANLSGYGNGSANQLTGNAGNNVLDGGAGIDTMIGGLGDDTYYVDVSGDVVTEAAGQGNDTVYSSAASYTLGDNIENLILSGTANINGTGNAGNNTITGNTGNNTINGGAGADTMIGGYGDDTYVVDNAGDTIVEISNNYGGTDTVQSSVNSYTLQLYLENLTLVGSAISGTGNKQWNVITGNALNNVLNGDEGNDTLIGGDGDDTYYVDAIGDVIIEEANQGNDTVYSSFSYVLGDNVENLVLTGTANLSGYGNGSANQLTGNAGNNVLDGGAGIDTMIGGLGDDTYYVDVSGDVVTEAAGQGNDTVYSSAASYTLGDNIENLILSGTANINGTGNAGNNTITGNTGNNTINGGAGADTMIGGYGDDTYVVDNAGDTIVEISNNYGGTDTVQSSVNSYTLQLYLENLTLVGSAISGTGNKQWNVITGNALNNVLNGDEGNDTLIGGDGDDTYYVDAIGDVIIEEANQGNDTVYSSFSYVLGDNVENLVLTGTANLSGYGNGSANQLTGNAGNNVLDGGAGIDTMIGGLGDDTYYVDVSGDVVTEAAGQGNDTVYSSAASYTLGDNIENLILSGTANINGTGNAGNNTITGNTGNNTINGGAGADTMIGGYGDDTYVVDNAGDTIVEISNNYGGTDTVQSSVNSYTLQLYLENLTLVGSAISGTGNKQWNVITGNALNNVLDGGLGNDTLTGGDGSDQFVFSTALGSTNVDTITDFAPGSDRIALDDAIFGALAGGVTGSNFFVGAPGAGDADDYLIYDNTTGALYYDADGAGGAAAVRFAQFNSLPTLSASDFDII